MLGHRSGDTLQFSPVVTFNERGGSPEEIEMARVEVLNKLSFFVAHSLHHLSNQYPTTGRPASGLVNNPSVLEQSTTSMGGPSMSHTRSESTQTIQGGWGGAGRMQMNLAKQVHMPTLSIDPSFTMTAHSGHEHLVYKEFEAWIEL
jgi:hypothetical protein